MKNKNHTITHILIHSTKLLTIASNATHTHELQRAIIAQEDSLYYSNIVINTARNEIDTLTLKVLESELEIDELKRSNINLKNIANEFKTDISHKNLEIFNISEELNRQKNQNIQASTSLDEFHKITDDLVKTLIKLDMNYEKLRRIHKQSRNDVKEELKHLAKIIIKMKDQDYIANLINEELENIIKSTTYIEDEEKAIKFKRKFKEKGEIGEDELFAYLNRRLSRSSDYDTVDTNTLNRIIELVKLSIDMEE